MIRRVPLVLGLAAVLCQPVRGSAAPNPGDLGGERRFVEVHLQDFDSALDVFRQGDYDVAGWDASRSVVGLVIDAAGIEALREQGYTVTAGEKAGGEAVEPDYVDFDEMVARLGEVESLYPGIAARVDLNAELSTPLTHEGRSVWALKISDNPQVNEDEPAVVIDGAHHARELMTPMAVLDIIDVLTEGYGTDPQVTAWVDAYEIWLVPMVNPDGVVYVFEHYDMWRKNRRYDPDTGAYGVDDNRNYTHKWGQCGSTSADPFSETYRGPSPESEGEVQTMNALFAREKPALYLSYHSYGNEVLYPYVCGTLAEETFYYGVRDAYAAAMGYGIRRASASGESFEDAYNEHGALAFLAEVGTAFQPPFSQVGPIVEGLRPGWRYLLARGLASALTGHVTDAATGDPLPEAQILVDEVGFVEGEVRNPEPLYGGYHRLLAPGAYNVTVGAPGHVPQTFAVTVDAVPSKLDVALQAGACPDDDGDGYTDEICGGEDCDDADPAIHPGVAEVCTDGVDNDCDGLVDGGDPDCPSAGWAAAVPAEASAAGTAPDSSSVTVNLLLGLFVAGALVRVLRRRTAAR